MIPLRPITTGRILRKCTLYENKPSLGKLFKSCSGSSFMSITTKSSAAVDWKNKSNYGWFLPIQTRWKDNDCYGHINNAVYHSIYDTVINNFLIRHLGLSRDSTSSSLVGFMVKTECNYIKPGQYPAIYLAGLSISHIGNTSLIYKTSMFSAKNETLSFCGGDLVQGHFKDDVNVHSQVLDHFEDSACCIGEYIHVFVNPQNANRPCKIPEDWKNTLHRLQS